MKQRIIDTVRNIVNVLGQIPATGLAALYLVAGSLGFYDFYTRGEAREALIVQDMLRSNDWILPRGYNNAVPSKPLLFHWLGGLLSLLYGDVLELTVRLPSFLFSLLCLATFLYLLRDELNTRGRWLFAGCLMLSFEWMRATFTARVDMAHSSSLSIGLLCGYFAINDRRRVAWCWAALWFGLATLGKGPVGLALPAIILGGWIQLSSQRRTDAFVHLCCALAVSGAIAGTWYLAAYWREPEQFLTRVWYENVSRFASTMADSPHDHSALYLLGVGMLGLMPWTLFILWLIYTSAPRRVRNTLEYLRGASPLFRFSLLTAFSVFSFYSIPSSKRGVYLLAGYPFVAISLALLLQHSEKTFTQYKAFITAGSVFVLLGQVTILLFVSPSRSERPLSLIVQKYLHDGEDVYSFGYEFYGASFYSGLRFLSLPKDGASISSPRDTTTHVAPGDLILFRDRNASELAAALADSRLSLKVERETLISETHVIIGRVEHRSMHDEMTGRTNGSMALGHQQAYGKSTECSTCQAKRD